MHRRRLPSLLLLVALAAVLPACEAGKDPCDIAANPVVKTSSPFPDVEAWVAAFAGSIRRSQPYDPPQQCEQDGFKLALVNAKSGDLPGAARYLNPMGYEVYDFTDATGRMAVFAEKSPGEGDHYAHGWGLYFIGIGQRAAPKLLIEAPHPRADLNSELVAAHAFAVSGAFYLGIAGAHRDAVEGHEGDEEWCLQHVECADMSHQPQSVFQAMHAVAVVLTQPGETRVYQSHGYGADEHAGLAGAQAVSAAMEEPTDVTRKVAKALGVPKDSEGNSVFGVCLVGEPLGNTCTDLRALKNVQAASMRPISGTAFVHVEASRAVRDDETRRNLLAKTIVDALK